MTASRLWLIVIAPLLIGAAAPPPLSAYAGHYPFDRVRGITFFDHPRFRAAVTAAVPDRRVRRWIIEPSGPVAPIGRRRDGRLVSWGCEAHNCGPHNWTVLIDAAGRRAEVCYYDASVMGQRSRWYAPGRAPALRNGGCPDE